MKIIKIGSDLILQKDLLDYIALWEKANGENAISISWVQEDNHSGALTIYADSDEGVEGILQGTFTRAWTPDE